MNIDTRFVRCEYCGKRLYLREEESFVEDDNGRITCTKHHEDDSGFEHEDWYPLDVDEETVIG